MCGGGNPLDVVSDVIGTGGGDQGLLNVVDEGVQSVGSGLAEVDDFVNEEIPGGWATVAAVAAPQLAPLLTGAALTAAEAAALSAGVSGTSSIIQGDPLDVALQKAALSGAGSYGSQYLLGGGSEFTGASETGLATLPGEGVAADLAGTTILGDLGLEGAAESAIDEAFTTPVIDAPINQYELSPRYDFSPNVPIEYVSPEYDPTGSLYTEARAPIYDFSPTTPVQYVSPELDPTGSLAKAGGISTMDVLRGVNLAKGLLGSSQEQAAAPATQFRGTRVPQGQVDYSGILNLLQMQSPQRRSLLG